MKLGRSCIDQAHLVLYNVLENDDLLHLDGEAFFRHNREFKEFVFMLHLREKVSHELLVKNFELILVHSVRVEELLVHAKQVLQS